jgi:hypothetical protein
MRHKVNNNIKTKSYNDIIQAQKNHLKKKMLACEITTLKQQ